MRKACIVVGSPYQKNKLFDLGDKDINRDNCMHPFYCLRQRMGQLGIDLATSDIHSPDEAEIVLYNDMPKRLPAKNNIHKSFLMLFEGELVRPDNWDIKKHSHFRKIFTWHDDYIDGKKYFKMHLPQEILILFDKNYEKKEKLCTLIAGNKLNAHRLELYSKRREAILWFEKNHPEDFVFYGIGWDSFTTNNRYINYMLSKFPKIQKYLDSNYKSYGGRVASKRRTLSKYKFAVCYENARDVPGYITEKIFDCMLAGCVPIYWGANNIEKYIPTQCFIDKRKFATYEALYEYISSMSDETYKKYLKDIDAYLSGERVHFFSSDYFVQNLLSELC